MDHSKPKYNFIVQPLFLCHTCVFLGQLRYLEICFLSTHRQMPQMITNIPCFLRRFCYFWSFGIIHLSDLFSRKNVPFDFERAFWEDEGALSKPKGPFFSRKWSSRNDKETPGTAGKSLLGPRKYLWRLLAFIKAWDWAREKVNIFHFRPKWCAQK